VEGRGHAVFGQVPISVITAVGYPANALQALKMKDAEFREFHLRRQREALVTLGPRAGQVIAERSGHLVQHDEPETVVAEVERLIELGRRGERRSSAGTVQAEDQLWITWSPGTVHLRSRADHAGALDELTTEFELPRLPGRQGLRHVGVRFERLR
jgi:hypothetical protein